MHYQVVGEGSPILFLHGFGGRMESFLPNFNALASNHKCILVDFIGFGESAEPNVPYTLYDYASSVELLLKDLDIKETNVIAHSFGCRVAFLLMAETSLIKKCVLACPAGVKPRRNIKYFSKVALYKIKKKLFKWGVLSNNFMSRCGSRDYRSLSPVMKSTFVNIVNFDVSPLLSKIQNEILLVYGEGDRDIPLYMIKKLHKNLVNSQYITLTGGHFCYLVEANNFNAIASSFLS